MVATDVTGRVRLAATNVAAPPRLWPTMPQGPTPWSMSQSTARVRSPTLATNVEDANDPSDSPSPVKSKRTTA